ncbi:MFS transporter [Streptomyces fumanus]|uniref:MFS transporter n=1 Tax=Streptomyces fumanus TaxID=67302 RepID=A0A919AZI8_9ACTN|nr:MFS transporter [Streptomyces fumanus]GHF34297.1 MFS transporter [Streptomyces fumanus]
MTVQTLPHKSRSSGAVLAVLSASQFLVTLNTSIVNVALPAIGADLHLSSSALTWIVNAYLIAFGALLPAGGRLADLFGRRRVFAAGLVLFTAGSIAASIPAGGALLIAGRAVQGVGAAVLSPAALAILLSVSPAGPARNKALGVWGAVSAAGGAAGVLFSGVLTSGLGWWAIFAVSAVIGLPLLLAVPALVPGDVRRADGRLDVLGALIITAGLLLLVYGLGRIDWSRPSTTLVAASGLALLLLLGPVERRAAEPLVPPVLLHSRSVVVGNVLMLLLGMVWVATFFFLPLYQQRVLGYSPLVAGVTQLPLAAALMSASTLAGRVKGTLVPGLLLLAGGLVWLARVPVRGGFLADLLGPTLLIGVGLGLAFVPLTALGVAGVSPDHAGVAGGLINTTRQVGGALGLAVLTSVAAGATGGGTSPAHLADGYRSALLTASGLVLFTALVAGAYTAWTRRHSARPAVASG